jgi:predicted secreted hydrolase
MTRKRALALFALLGVVGVIGAALVFRPFDPAEISLAPDAQADWMAALAGQDGAGFARPSGDWALRLPDDHAAHPAQRSELWQMSAQVQGPDLAPISVQFSILRQGVTPPADAAGGSIWDLRDLYRAHVITSGYQGAQGQAEERFARGFAGVAGYDNDLQELRLDDWALRFGDDTGATPWQFAATAGEMQVALEFEGLKPPLPLVAPDAPFRGYAVSRLGVTGTITTPEGAMPVTGLAWFDHVWGELPLPGAAPVVSDRLLVQLDTGDDLVLITSRRRDGQGSPTVDAVMIGADGHASQINAQRAELEFLRLWQGELGIWPIEWQITLDDTLDLTVSPVWDAQEYAFATPVWSGLVTVAGVHNGQPVRGTGLLQLAQGGM